MVKIAWKTIKGYGPYAYLQQSVKLKDGKVISQHLAYLGKLGSNGLVPGHHFSVPLASKGSKTKRVFVPWVSPELKEELKPSSSQMVKSVEAQVKAGIPVKQIKVGKAASLMAPGPAKKKTPKTASGAGKKTGSAPGTKPTELGATQAPQQLGATTPVAKPSLQDVPKDPKDKPLITLANVKKLEAAAQDGLPALEKLGQDMEAKMLAQAKKAAIANAVAELKSQMLGTPIQEGEGESELAATIEAVKSGDQALPKQSVPTSKVIDEQDDQMVQGSKNWDQDLMQVSGKKGSNEGGLFKDKKLQSFHYVKWSGSEARARMEALVALLYTYAGVPVPISRPIELNGQTAVMSDWLDEATPMTIAQMKAHPDVRENFAVDAWLANWDVIGMSADNVVKAEGGKAYRIDLGGSLIFRAQGKGKHLPPHVPELETMLNPGTNPQAAKVFAGLSAKELKAGADKLARISDHQIDQAVDLMKIPKTSPQYPASEFGDGAKDLPQFLKSRLKQRRDYIVQEVLDKEAKKEESLAQLKKAVNLKPDSVESLMDHASVFTPHGSASAKKQLQTAVMQAELGKAKGTSASNAVAKAYKQWKGSTDTPGGRLIRWGAGELEDTGDQELRRLQKFNTFLAEEGRKPSSKAEAETAELHKSINSKAGPLLVQGLKVTREANRTVLHMQHPGQKVVTVYRTWPPDQVKHLNLHKSKIGEVLTLDDPPTYSWTFDPGVFSSAGHGSIRVQSKVPTDKLVLTDRVNNTFGSFSGEDEVVFKGVKKHKMEVIKK